MNALVAWGSDTLVLAGREVAHWRKQPAAVLINWAFPVMIALIFGGLFGGAMNVPGGIDYFAYLMPGMFAVTMFFGLEATMLGVSQDAGKGVTDRFRSLPLAGSSIVLGRCLADLLSSVVGLAVMVGAAWLLGWWWQGTAEEAFAAFTLLLLFRLALLAAGVSLGLAAGPDLVMTVQILLWPVMFLSSAFVDPATMPAWLAAVSEWNPLSATASAARELFGAPHPSNTWASDHAVLLALAWPAVLLAVFVPLAARQYRHLR